MQRHFGTFVLLLIGALATLGCGGSAAVDKAVADVGQAASQVATAVENAAAGEVESRFEFALATEMKTSVAYARLISTGGGRPNVLSIASHDDGPREPFPSVYLHAETTAAQRSQLAGQTLTAQLFAQAGPSAPIWYTETPVQLAIGEATERSLTASIAKCRFVQAESGEAKEVPVKIVAEWK